MKGFGNRPVLTNLRVHNGIIKECLGFYPVQVEAYKALVKALCDHYDIPIECPRDDDGNTLMKVHPPSAKAKFRGVVSHFHLTRNKWDTANLDLGKTLEEINKEYKILKEVKNSYIEPTNRIKDLFDQIKNVNKNLWDVEDQLRICEKNKDFGDNFIKLARSVYFNNDKRSKIKLEINNFLGSNIKEIKLYAKY